MKYLVAVFALLGAVSSAPFNNNAVPPAMRGMLLDMLKNLLNQQGGGGGSPFKPHAAPPMPFKPLPTQGSAFMRPPPPPMPPQRVCPQVAHRGYAPPMYNHIYCPPGPTSSDSCKDKKLFEALYCPDGSPRYDWVPPRNPWDSSIPDNVKDRAQNILVFRVNNRPSRTPTPKEWELMSLLGDPKDGIVNNPFAAMG